jgi:NADPH:quinone reductase-like Zn-dependent oxidoreductase
VSRAVVFDRYGDPARVLRLDRQRKRPTPGAGEVLIRVLVRPVHPGDLAGIAEVGRPEPAMPHAPGVEGMGIIEAVGDGGSGFEPGRRVAFFPARGAWSEYVVAPARFVVPVPDQVSDATASLMLVNTITMLMLLRAVEDGWAGSPRSALQTAAGSSVGRLVSAAAERHGYPLVNLVRSTEGAAALADRFPSIPVIATSDPDWPARVRAALGGPASVALDAVGGSIGAELLGLLAEGGTLISYGALAGEALPIAPSALVPRELRVRGVSIGRWTTTRTLDEQAEDMAFALELARARPDLLEVAASYDLAEYQAAVAEAGRPGKVGSVLLASPAGPDDRSQ